GALRLGAALRADRWRTRYVSDPLTATASRPGLASRLAYAWHGALAQLAVGLRPSLRPRGAPLGARGFAAWAWLRYPALLGLPVSLVAIAAYATREPLPLRWYLNLAAHLALYLALRVTVRMEAAV